MLCVECCQRQTEREGEGDRWKETDSQRRGDEADTAPAAADGSKKSGKHLKFIMKCLRESCKLKYIYINAYVYSMCVCVCVEKIYMLCQRN